MESSSRAQVQRRLVKQAPHAAIIMASKKGRGQLLPWRMYEASTKHAKAGKWIHYALQDRLRIRDRRPAHGSCLAAEKYSGPVPPKPDIPYLLHASTLVETEVANAQQGKKSDQYTISGASSPARTPLAEPIFIIDARQIQPETFELYRLDVKGGNREVSLERQPPARRIARAASRRQASRRPSLPRRSGRSTGKRRIRAFAQQRQSAFCFEIY